jgi:hypothetical protein
MAFMFSFIGSPVYDDLKDTLERTKFRGDVYAENDVPHTKFRIFAVDPERGNSFEMVLDSKPSTFDADFPDALIWAGSGRVQST